MTLKRNATQDKKQGCASDMLSMLVFASDHLWKVPSARTYPIDQPSSSLAARPLYQTFTPAASPTTDKHVNCRLSKALSYFAPLPHVSWMLIPLMTTFPGVFPRPEPEVAITATIIQGQESASPTQSQPKPSHRPEKRQEKMNGISKIRFAW